MLTRPEGVHAASLGHGMTAVLNVGTGRWVWMDEDTRRIWEAALGGGSALRVLIDSVVARGHDRQQVRTALSSTLATLHEHGLFAEPPPPRRRRRPLWRVITCR
ncbi:hypothetical protein AB0D00_26415 [Streptomyces sp. NPDC048213]|uniref:hypothetical protein n=1 Tax=Streptomyces sp. NPDC048213 TaxID=3160984 RepID=UPI0033DD59FB